MRIISGRFRGKNIIAPASLPVRPTTDFAKTGLFNILNNKVEFEKVSFLDLFSGTGNISYEFISRGCTRITAVDADRQCIRFITDTAERLQAAGVRVIREDVFRFLMNCPDAYDVIFADPPFDLQKSLELPSIIFQNNLLKPGGWFILEHASGKELNIDPHFKETRKYGHVSFSFFQESVPSLP